MYLLRVTRDVCTVHCGDCGEIKVRRMSRGVINKLFQRIQIKITNGNSLSYIAAKVYRCCVIPAPQVLYISSIMDRAYYNFAIIFMYNVNGLFLLKAFNYEIFF